MSSQVMHERGSSKEMKKISENEISAGIARGRKHRQEGRTGRAVEEFMKVISGISRNDDPCLYNKVLNEIEITRGNTVLESKPRRLGITLTTRCNLRCVMCKIRETPWDLPEKAVGDIIRFFPYVRYIMWLGGEVFLSKHFEALYEEAAQYPHLKQAIFTSGVLIDDRLAQKLVNKNTMLSFSIDGFTKHTYEYVREGARFESLLKSIDLINRYKRRYNNSTRGSSRYITGINFTVMKSNYGR